MDPEVRAYLDSLAERLERVEAAVATGALEVRSEMAQLAETLRGEMAQQAETLRGEIRGEVQTLRADLAGLGREVSNLREGMADMERRLMEAIRHRREDEDLAFREIVHLKRRVSRLEKRVTTLEGRGGSGQQGV